MGQIIDDFIGGIKQIGRAIIGAVKNLINAGKQAWQSIKSAITLFWAKTVRWFGQAVQAVEKAINKEVMCAETYLKKVNGQFQEVSYHYSQLDNGQFQKDTVIKQEFIPLEDVPLEFQEIAANINEGGFIDTTKATGVMVEKAEAVALKA